MVYSIRFLLQKSRLVLFIYNRGRQPWSLHEPHFVFHFLVVVQITQLGMKKMEELYWRPQSINIVISVYDICRLFLNIDIELYTHEWSMLRQLMKFNTQQ